MSDAKEKRETKSLFYSAQHARLALPTQISNASTASRALTLHIDDLDSINGTPDPTRRDI